MSGSLSLPCLAFAQLILLPEREPIVSQLDVMGFESPTFEQRPKPDPEVEEVLFLVAR